MQISEILKPNIGLINPGPLVCPLYNERETKHEKTRKLITMKLYGAKKETLYMFFLKLKLQNNIFKHCNVCLSLGRHQTTTCTNMFSDFINYCGFIQLIQNIDRTSVKLMSHLRKIEK